LEASDKGAQHFSQFLTLVQKRLDLLLRTDLDALSYQQMCFQLF